MDRINPTALAIIAFFTAVAATGGEWLTGLTVGLGTVVACSLLAIDDMILLLFGGCVLACLLLVV